MPNVIEPSAIPEGFFYDSDKTIDYHFAPSDYGDLEKPVGTISLIGQSEDGNHYYYKLLDVEEETIALLRLKKEIICGKAYFRIYKIGTKKEYRKSGYAKYLYNLALRHCNGSLVSDRTLTMPGSYNIWESFIKSREEGSYTVSVINTKDCSEHKYDGKKRQTHYWGHEEHYLEEYKSDSENLDLMFADDSWGKELCNYLKSNLDQLSDKKHIRLMLTYKN